MTSCAIGVDLGGSHVSTGVINTTGELLELQEVKIDNLAPPEITLQLIADTIKKLNFSKNQICGIGIGMPGNHDSVHGICKFSPNFPKWHDVHVTDHLSKALNLPVQMLNDVRVATLGEYHFGAGKGAKNLVMLAIGTGIGGGIIINGKLVIGKDEASGEIGHMTIDPHGPLCNCGNRGCLEALASGPSITARGMEAIVHGRGDKIRARIKSLEELTPKIIADAAQQGDSNALQIFAEAGKAIGIAIANLAVTLDPDCIIIGGGVAQAGNILFSPLFEEISNRVYIFPAKQINVVPAKLGVRAGLIGAAAYAFLQNHVNIP